MADKNKQRAVLVDGVLQSATGELSGIVISKTGVISIRKQAVKRRTVKKT